MDKHYYFLEKHQHFFFFLWGWNPAVLREWTRCQSGLRVRHPKRNSTRGNHVVVFVKPNDEGKHVAANRTQLRKRPTRSLEGGGMHAEVTWNTQRDIWMQREGGRVDVEQQILPQTKKKLAEKSTNKIESSHYRCWEICWFNFLRIVEEDVDSNLIFPLNMKY